MWVHGFHQALVKVVIHGLLLNCKTGVSEIPQRSVLTLVILTVFIIEMIDAAERAVVKFASDKKCEGGLQAPWKVGLKF